MIHNRRGAAGNQESYYKPRRSFARVLELQGLPKNFLEDAPFTIEGKYKVVGNGVPLCSGGHRWDAKSWHVMGPASFQRFWRIDLEEIAAGLATMWREQEGA